MQRNYKDNEFLEKLLCTTIIWELLTVRLNLLFKRSKLKWGKFKFYKYFSQKKCTRKLFDPTYCPLVFDGSLNEVAMENRPFAGAFDLKTWKNSTQRQPKKNAEFLLIRHKMCTCHLRNINPWPKATGAFTGLNKGGSSKIHEIFKMFTINFGWYVAKISAKLFH